MNGKIALCLILVAATLAAGSIACAHKSMINYSYSEGKATTLCTYSDGSPMKNSRIKVNRGNGMRLAAGKTDDSGKFSFDLPGDVKKIKIVVQDIMGHRAEVEIEGSALRPS